jgi:hypothetical protein
VSPSKPLSASVPPRSWPSPVAKVAKVGESGAHFAHANRSDRQAIIGEVERRQNVSTRSIFTSLDALIAR